MYACCIHLLTQPDPQRYLTATQARSPFPIKVRTCVRACVLVLVVTVINGEVAHILARIYYSIAIYCFSCCARVYVHGVCTAICIILYRPPDNRKLPNPTQSNPI